MRDASEKEGGHGHRPCEETRAPDFSLVRRMQLQKSAGSILASNKLARSAPKRVAVQVNGGLGGAATERWHESVTYSCTVSLETMAGASSCAGVKRCRIGGDLEWRENVIQRSSDSLKGGPAVVGPGL